MKTLIYLIAFILISSCVTTTTRVYEKRNTNQGQYVLEVKKKSARQISDKLNIPKDLKHLSESDVKVIKWTLYKKMMDKRSCDTIIEQTYKTIGSTEKSLYLVMKGYPAIYANPRPMLSSDSLLLDAGKLVLLDSEKWLNTKVITKIDTGGALMVGFMGLLNFLLLSVFLGQ